MEVLSQPSAPPRPPRTPTLSYSSPATVTSPATEDTLSMPGTPMNDPNEHALSSTEISPVEAGFAGNLRRQEVESEAANALMFQKSPLRRSSARARPYSAYETLNASSTSLNSILPWNTGNVPTRKISVSSVASSTRPGPRRASTAVNPTLEFIRGFEGLQRRPSQMSVRMRRESVAEKAKSHESLVHSPEIVGGPFQEMLDSPTARSHWSDHSDNEDEEDESDPKSPVLGPVLDVPDVSTTPAIGEEEGSIHISMARRVSRTASNSAMLPIFLRASKMSREASTSRRPSSFSVNSLDGQHKQNDLVRLVTALQSSHLEETRRLNEIIASLSTKVAALERDLLYATTPPASAHSIGPVSPPFGTSPYPAYSSPRNSLTPADVKWKHGSIGGHYRFDTTPLMEGPGCGRRMSAMSASSPRTAAVNYI